MKLKINEYVPRTINTDYINKIMNQEVNNFFECRNVVH